MKRQRKEEKTGKGYDTVWLVVVNVEDGFPEVFVLYASYETCKLIMNALVKSHAERRKGEITTFNHVTLTNHLFYEGSVEDLTFVKKVADEKGSEVEEDWPVKEALMHYFGTEVLPSDFEVTPLVSEEDNGQACFFDSQHCDGLLVCCNFH